MGGGAQEPTGPDFEKGVAFGDLVANKPVVGHAEGEAVVVVRVGDDVHAIGASCTHYGGPLGEGIVEGTTIRCPWHHARFDVTCGMAVGAPALGDVACWNVVRAGDLVRVQGKKARAAKHPKASPASVVIVGGGAAAAAAIETLRKEGYEGPITMLSGEAPGPVDRPNLSKDYLAGKAPEEWIPVGGREHYENDLRVTMSVDDPVTAIDTAEKTVTTKSGKVIGYDALLYATGAEPVRLSIEGGDRANVFTLRSLADSRAIITQAEAGKRAVVIGASFIGLEVAASLRQRGVDVEVVAPDKTPLSRVLGDDVGMFVRSIHEGQGARFHLGTTPKAFKDGYVELADGSSIPCDFVVLGVGVKARVALAEAAGIRVENGGVVVDELLRTSAPGVWAAGDVARYPDPRSGQLARVEHWVVAERQGEAAARAMLGQGRPYRDAPFFWSAHHDVTISYVGFAPKWDEARVSGSLADRDATIAYRSGGKVLAVATIQRDQVSLAVEAAMERGDDAAIEELVK